jgi:hypothetical protein
MTEPEVAEHAGAKIVLEGILDEEVFDIVAFKDSLAQL